MSGLQLKDIRKSYGGLEVIHGVNLEVEEGEFVVFVGPSGCGKSTLLRMIAGLEEITEGDLLIGGEVVNRIAPARRGIAMVFQSYALYPHMTAEENMSFSLRIAKFAKEQIETRMRRSVEMLKLGDYLDRKPKALSGGQRQRVAIGRAIVRDPKVFLFDEPLSNLDAALRVATRIEIAKLKETLPDTTIVYVTHDQIEAMTLADRIVVLSEGRIEQVGTPVDLYERPENLFVARFIGSPAMNIFPARVAGTGRETTLSIEQGGSVAVPIATDAGIEGESVSLGIRPEHMSLADPELAMITGTVSIVEYLGEASNVYVDHPGAGEIIAKVPGAPRIEPGAAIGLTAEPERMHVFGPDGHTLRPVS